MLRVNNCMGGVQKPVWVMGWTCLARGRGDARSVAAGVVVFVGLTAWDTQPIKVLYREEDWSAVSGKKAIIGALSLYLDFINLFILLMQLMGGRRKE